MPKPIQVEGLERPWQRHVIVPPLKWHSIPVLAAALSPDGRRLITGDNSGRILVWDVQTKAYLREFAPVHSQVQIIKFSPSGKYVAVGSKDVTYEYSGQQFAIYSVADGKKLGQLCRCAISDARFIDDERVLVDLGKKRVEWSFKTGIKRYTWAKFTAGATKAHKPEPPYKLVEKEGDFVVKSAQGASHWKLRHGSRRLWAGFDARNPTLVTVDSDGLISRRSPTTGKTARTHKMSCKLGERRLRPALFGGSIALSVDGRALVVNLNNGRCKRLWRGTGPYADLCPDGALMAVADNKSAVVIDVASGRVLQRYKTSLDYHETAGFTLSGESVVFTGYRKKARERRIPWIAFMNRASGNLDRVRRCMSGHGVFNTTPLSSERIVVTRGMAYAFDVVRRRGPKPSLGVGLSELEGDMSQSQLHGTATLDGRAFAHTDLGGRVTVWSAKTWKRIRSLQHNLEVDGLAFSPCGRYLAVLLEDGSVTYYRTHL